MGELSIRNGLKIIGALPSGTGDDILTVDSSSSSVGKVPAIDTSVFVSKTLPSANIYVGNGSNVATAVPVTGDITVDNAGVTSIASGVIVNADINAAAAITFTKMVPLTASMALASDASGYVVTSAVTATELGYLSGVTSGLQAQLNGKQATITGAASTVTTSNLTVDRAVISNGSGKIAVSAVTSTELGYLSGATSSIQTQLNAKQPNIQFKDEGSNAGTSGGITTVDFVGAGVTASAGAGTLTVTINGVANGVPAGGTAGQYLNKIDGTDYNTQWSTLVLSAVTDVTALAADVNLLTGLAAYGITTSELQYLNGAASNIQAQLDAITLRSPALGFGELWRGSVGGNAVTLSPGSVGQVLTMSGGQPVWASLPSSGHTIYNGTDVSPLTTRSNLRIQNGLTASDSAPDTVVKLGGALIENTTIGGTNFILGLSSDDGVGNSSLISLDAGVLTMGTGDYVGATTAYSYSEVGTAWFIGTSNLGGTQQSSMTAGPGAFSITSTTNTDVDSFGTLNLGASDAVSINIGHSINTVNIDFASNDGAVNFVGNGTTDYFSIDNTGGATAGIDLMGGTGTSYGNLKIGLVAGRSFLFNFSGNAIFEDTRVTPHGVEYNADYSSNFTSRSLIDKGYADGAYWKLTGASVLTGTTEIYPALADDGLFDLSIGVDYAQVEGWVNNLQLGGINSAIYSQSGNSFSVGPTSAEINAGGHNLTFSTTAAQITASGTNFDLTSVGAGIFTIQKSGTGAFNIADGRVGAAAVGIEYATDYSANFTARSLIDKGYADSTYAPISGGAYWSLASGGTLTGSNTITSNTANWLNFTGTWTATASNQFMAQFGGTITATTGAGERVYGYLFNPSITGGATNAQSIFGVAINPTLTGGVDNGDFTSALFVNPTFAGTFATRYGIVSIASSTTAFTGLRVQNSSTGSAVIDLVADNSSGINYNSARLEISRSNGINGVAGFNNSGTGGFNFVANAATILTIKSGSLPVSTESYGLLLNTQGVLRVDGSNLRMYWSASTYGEVNMGTTGSSGGVNILTSAQSATFSPTLRVTSGAHTALTAPLIANEFLGSAWSWGSGTGMTQIFTHFKGFTTNTSGSATITHAATVWIDPITAGSITPTNNWALVVNGNSFYNGTIHVYGASGIANSSTITGYTSGYGIILDSNSGGLGTSGVRVRNFSGDTAATVILSLGTSSVNNYFQPTSGSTSRVGVRVDAGLSLTSGTWTGSYSLFIAGGTHTSSTIAPTSSVNFYEAAPALNLTTGTMSVRGLYYNPSITSIAGVSSHYAFHSTSGGVLLAGGLTTADTGATLTANTKLDVRAGGTSGSDVGLRVANSSNANPLTYSGDGTLTFSGTRILAGNGGALTLAPDANSQMLLRANYSSTATSTGVFRFYNTNGNYTATSGSLLIAGVEMPFAPTSGTATLTGLGISGTVNQTGGANGAVTGISLTPTYTAAGGVVYGIRYNPTVTSITGAHYAFESTSGIVVHTMDLGTSAGDGMSVVFANANNGGGATNGVYSYGTLTFGASWVGNHATVKSGPTYNINASASGHLIGFDHDPVLTGVGVAKHLAFRATSGSVLIGAAAQVANTGVGGIILNNAATNASAAQTNGIVIHAKDSSDGSANSTLALYLEQAVEAIGTFTASHKLKIWINGTEYWIQLDAV